MLGADVRMSADVVPSGRDDGAAVFLDVANPDTCVELSKEEDGRDF